MRLLRLLATAVLAAGALGGLFIAFCVLPKVEAAEADWHTLTPGWISSVAALTDYWMLDAIYLLAALLVVAFVIACLPFVGESVRRIARGTIHVQAWATAAAAIYLLVISAAGMIYVNEDLWQRNHIYACVLDQFSLLQVAEGKADQLQALKNKLLSAKLVEVQDPSSLTHDERTEQITGILYGLKSSKDPVFLKQLLATSDSFRADFVSADFRSKPILEAAALCSAPATDINAFYAWLEPKIGTDGWNKLPLQVLEFSH